jgi:hypothetical protein
MLVPVVNKNNKPLMPTNSSRAKKWILSGRATFFWKKGVYCIRMNSDVQENIQPVACGIDPGSKREAYSVKSAYHTYLNVLSDTPQKVKEKVEQRRIMRRARRFRNTRYRPSRFNNRKKSRLPPSTKSRWQLKLRLVAWLLSILPIEAFVVEDISAETKKGARKWNSSFSPLEVGKHWFYKELAKLGEVITKEGWETAQLREDLGLKKSSAKLSDKFECHNIDSWVLANWYTGGHTAPDNKEIVKMIPLQFHRRQLHALQCSKGGKRREYGSTRSMGFKRGSLVKHNKYGLCYVGGTSKGRISVHDLSSGERISQNVKIEDCVFKTYLSFRKE